MSSSTSPGLPPAIVSANAVREWIAECTLTRRSRFAVGPLSCRCRLRLAPGATDAGARARTILTASGLATGAAPDAEVAAVVVTLASATVSPRTPAETRARDRPCARGVDVVTGRRAYRRPVSARSLGR